MKKRNSQLKIVKRIDGEDASIFSAFLYKNNDIYVNIQKLWNDTHSSKKFIIMFSKAIAHENVHREISFALGKKRRSLFGEERIVRKMCNEKFPKHHQEYYKKLDGKMTKRFK